MLFSFAFVINRLITNTFKWWIKNGIYSGIWCHHLLLLSGADWKEETIIWSWLEGGVFLSARGHSRLYHSQYGKTVETSIALNIRIFLYQKDHLYSIHNLTATILWEVGQSAKHAADNIAPEIYCATSNKYGWQSQKDIKHGVVQGHVISL